MNPAMKERLARPCPFGEWISVESSNIQQIKYEPAMGFLWVQFHASASGGTGLYGYVAVPKFRFRNLIRARSVGSYFQKYVARKYSTMKEIVQ